MTPLAVWLAQSGPDVRYAGPAAGAREAAERRREIAGALRSMGLENLWRVRAEPPGQGRKWWSLWLHRDSGEENDAAVKFSYWAALNTGLIAGAAGESVLGRFLTRRSDGTDNGAGR